MRRLWALIPILFFSCIASAENPTNSYQVAFSITRDGGVISKPSLMLKAGKQAEFTVDFEQPDHAIRVLATVNSSSAGVAGKEAAQLDLSFFEQYQGEWILRSEPSATVYLGKPSSFSISSEGLTRMAPTFGISFTINRGDGSAPAPQAGGCPEMNSNLIGGVRGDKVGSQICPPSNHTNMLGALFGISPAYGAPAQPASCCSAFCKGGGTLTCCNAISCCEMICGNCCDPP